MRAKSRLSTGAFVAAAALCLTFAGCGKDPPPDEKEENGNGNGEEDPDCFTSPTDPDRDRYLVLAHPYGEDGSQEDRYAVYKLDPTGAITPLDKSFSMSRATEGRIVFTPDGSLGLIAQTDGSIGIFRLDEEGNPEVIEAGYREGFYAGDIVLDVHSRRLWVLDSNWEEHGGGLLAFDLDCEGGLSLVSKVPGRSARGMALLAPYPDRAVLAARAFDGPVGVEDLFLLDISAEGPETLDSVSVFADDDAIVSAVATTMDGAYALIADNSGFSSVPNRIAVAAIEDDGLSFVQTLSPMEDPAAIVVSPFGDAAIATSGFGNAVYLLVHDPTDVDAPFRFEGEIDYVGPRPGIPVSAVGIERGALMGLVLVSEYISVRLIEFQGDGTVLDLGAGWTGDGMAEMVGAIGVQP